MNSIQRLWTTWLILAFVGTNVPCAKAGEVTVPLMPKPGTMVQLSVPFIPSHLQGLTIHPENALKFDFLVHKGDGNLTLVQKKEEYTKLVKPGYCNRITF